MRDSLRFKSGLFIVNRDVFKTAFPMESDMLFPVCASVFMNCGRTADAEKLKATRKLLKSTVGVFSNFRSTAELPLVAMLAASDAPEERLKKALAVYDVLKKRFFSSEYLPVAAMMLSGMIESERFEEVSERAKKIYDLMKKEHPFLTSSEDSVFAVMLALSDKSDETLVREVEACYSTLKDKFYDRNALQSLSHVLTLAGDDFSTVSYKCRDTIRLFDALKEKKYKYDTGYGLSTVGVLATLPCGVEETARDLIEAAEFLKTKKGYGFFGFDKQQRLLHASMIVTAEHMGGSDAMTGATVGSALSMIAAQQSATCALIAANVAATSAARST
jgi:hypothetical protein